MSEFLIRGANVAIPEVDVGDDIIVVRDDADQITRVQVKTANAVENESKVRGQFDAQFSIPIDQLKRGPEKLVYVFAVRRRDRWEEFVLISRAVLARLQEDYDALGGDGKKQTLNLTFTPTSVRYKSLGFQPFRNRFAPWPPADEIPADVLVDL